MVHRGDNAEPSAWRQHLLYGYLDVRCLAMSGLSIRPDASRCGALSAATPATWALAVAVAASSGGGALPAPAAPPAALAVAVALSSSGGALSAPAAPPAALAVAVAAGLRDTLTGGHRVGFVGVLTRGAAWDWVRPGRWGEGRWAQGNAERQDQEPERCGACPAKVRGQRPAMAAALRSSLHLCALVFIAKASQRALLLKPMCDAFYRPVRGIDGEVVPSVRVLVVWGSEA